MGVVAPSGVFTRSFIIIIAELFRAQFKLKEYIRIIQENDLSVCLISGRQDYFFVRSVKRAHRKMSDSSLFFIDKCGHVCSIEKHEVFNYLMLNFLNGLNNPQLALA